MGRETIGLGRRGDEREGLYSIACYSFSHENRYYSIHGKGYVSMSRSIGGEEENLPLAQEVVCSPVEMIDVMEGGVSREERLSSL